MTGVSLQDEGWILREAAAADIDDLMQWFPAYDDMPHADVCYYLTRPAKTEES